MTPSEIARLEHASRSALAWFPEHYEGRKHVGSLLAATLPAVSILAASAALLLAML